MTNAQFNLNQPIMKTFRVTYRLANWTYSQFTYVSPAELKAMQKKQKQGKLEIVHTHEVIPSGFAEVLPA